MGPIERRQQLLEVLCRRRHDTYGNLANEFGVCKETIRHDIAELMRFYPIEAVRGRHGGGVQVANWFRLDRKRLSSKQTALLRKLSGQLEGEDLDTLNSILLQFAP